MKISLLVLLAFFFHSCILQAHSATTTTQPTLTKTVLKWSRQYRTCDVNGEDVNLLTAGKEKEMKISKHKPEYWYHGKIMIFDCQSLCSIALIMKNSFLFFIIILYRYDSCSIRTQSIRSS